MSKKRITILIPSYNEEQNIGSLLGRLDALASGRLEPAFAGGSSDLKREDVPDMRDYDWEFLFVNDGSRDATLERLHEARAVDSRVSVLNLSRNFGKEAALLAGLDYASGDAVVIIDADLQHPPESIPEMIYWWDCRGYADVYGRRLTRGKESIVRKKLSLAFYRLLSGTARFPILENVGDFRLLDRQAVDAARSLRESQRLNKGIFSWIGYPKKDVAFIQSDRTAGKSSFNLRTLFNLAIDGITSFTTAPLRISAGVGLVVSILSILYAIYIAVRTICYGDPVAGFPTLICVILLLGGLQLIALGIIGEYIGRIFMETKERPVYLAESYNGQKVMREQEAGYRRQGVGDREQGVGDRDQGVGDR